MGKPAFNPNEPFEEVGLSGGGKPAFDPNKPFEDVQGLPSAKPAFKPDKPAVEIEEAPRVPLPRPRPDMPAPPEGGGERPFLTEVGESFMRGYHQRRQEGSALILGGESRALQNLDSIEARLASGERPEDIPDGEDLLGARWMSPEERRAQREGIVENMGGAATRIAERAAAIKALPVNPVYEKFATAPTYGEGLKELAKSPIRTIANLGAESALTMVPGLVGGLVGGPVGYLAGTHLGSYGSEYASDVLDAMRDDGVNTDDPEEIKAAAGNAEKMKEWSEKAHQKAQVVAALDTAAGKVAGSDLLPHAVRPKNVVARKLAEMPIQTPVQQAAGGAGEWLGSHAQGEEPVPGAVLAEMVGELAGTPGEVFSATLTGRGERKPDVKLKNLPVGESDIEKGVKEGTIQVAPPSVQGEPPNSPPVAPGAPPADVGGATTPLPTDTPVVSTDGGVVTTTTLHGPADAYMIDTTGERPWLVPAPDGSEIVDPAVRVFGAEAESTPVEGLYSRLKSWVEEKGPLNATAQRWISQLKRGDFTQEEARDLRLPQFFASTSGKISKEEVVDYITAMTAPMVEVTRTPMTPEMRKVEETRISAQIAAVARANPDAVVGGQIDFNHPRIAPLVDEIANLNRNVKWARYEEYTTPGPRESYTELTMHLPEREARPAPEPQGEVVSSPDGRVHTVTIDGSPVTSFHDRGKAERTLKRELDAERKSRQEQMTKQANYIGGHYVTPNELVTVRMTIRTDPNGRTIALIEEIQSDLHQRGKAVGYAEPGSLKGFVSRPTSDIPFKEGWAQLGFTRAVMWAASKGITQIAWTSGEEQTRRYATGTEGELAQRAKGMQDFYNRKVTGIAKRWAKRLGGTVMYTTVPGEAPFVVQPFQPPPYTGAGILPPVPSPIVWKVVDPMVGPNLPVRTFGTQAEAETFVVANTPPSNRFRVLQLPSTALETIAMGVPSYASRAVPDTVGAQVVDDPTKAVVSQAEMAAVQPLVNALDTLIKRLDLGVSVKIQLHNGPIKYKVPSKKNPGKMSTKKWLNTFGLARTIVDVHGKVKGGVIHINVPMHQGNMVKLWATMTHEMGHIVMYTSYTKASAALRGAVDAAYQKYRASVDATTHMTTVTGVYNNPTATAAMAAWGNTTLGELSAKDQAYWAGFNEWFAEQVATWAVTRSKPLSLVEKFFSGLAKKLTTILQEAKAMFKLPYTGVPELNAFLDSFLETADQSWGHDVNVATQQEGTVKNNSQMEDEEPAPPPQVETGGIGGVVGTVFNGRPPKEVQQTLAYADKFGWRYKWFTGIHQLAMKNPHIAALQEYVETVQVAQQTKQAIMIRAQEVLKLWNKLGRLQADAVSALLDDVQNMTYRTPQEVQNRVARHPTQQELLTLAQKHGVSRAGLGVYVEVSKTFQEFLARYEKVLQSEALKISDATRQQLKMAAIQRQMAALRSKPYFPALRFGAYTLTIRDAAGKVIHFETFESKRDRERAAAAIQGKYGVPDDQMQKGLLNKEVRPLLGVPTQLLDLMESKLNLSSTQRDALEQLKFELSPAQSFQHRFQHKRRIAGYSMDFRRAYANYFFHGANHLMKAQYADRMRALAKMIRDVVRDAPDITKREGIKYFTDNHLDHWLDPKSDWAIVRSIAAMFGLAFSAAAATQNLTQTMLTSFPFLGHHFGDVKAAAAIANAGRKLQTFYTKGKLDQSSFQTKAIFQGMQDGYIKETQAPELAGYADGNVLGLGFGGNILQRAMTKFNEIGMFMFEMTEQFNRRIVFRATLQLAMENPQAKYAQDAVARRKLTYDQRRAEGWTEAEAAAYCVAIDATDNTQFRYGREFAPRIFRGKLRSVFVFKTFYQSYILFLAQNWGITIRSLLVLAGMGGLMAMPGADDLDELLRAILWSMPGGRDFQLSHEIRRWILELCKDDTETGNMVAEIALHGIARKGFGIPGLMDMIGGTVGVDVPIPTFDRSRAISMGTMLPIDLGKMFGPPVQEPERIIAEQTQKASGAVFGLGFSLYKALRNQQLDWNDFKRWEQAVPRGVANVSKAYRAWNEGGSRTNSGAMIVKYDVRDTEQMMEVIGMGLGYNPYRQSYEWEKKLSQRDAEKLWDVQREGLMRQFGNAALGGDPDEKSKVLDAIRNFNTGLPDEARGKAITGDSLKKSVETRAKNRALEERGLPQHKSSIPIFRREDELYPQSMREIRRVGPARSE